MPRGATCARLAFDSGARFHAVFTLLGTLQVEACGEIDRATPLETPEVLVARFYANSADVQVFVESLARSGFDDGAGSFQFSVLRADYKTYMSLYSCLQLAPLLKVEVGFVLTRAPNPTSDTVQTLMAL